MTYDQATISAAVETYAMQRAVEDGLSAHDADRLAPLMQTAIEKIGLQISLEGMPYAQALAMVEESAMAIGVESQQSNELAARAYANRNTPVPLPAAPVQATVPRAAALTSAPEPVGATAVTAAPSPAYAGSAGALVEEGPGIDPDLSGDGLPAIVADPAAHAPVAALPLPPVPIPAPVAAPAIIRSPVAPAVEPLLEHVVHMQKVVDVMPWLAQSSRAYLFDFEIPVVAWEDGRMHPRIPKKIRYQYNLPDLHAVLYALATDTVTNLVGPTACGKTELVKQIGVAVNMPVTLVPMDAGISRNQLIGQRGIMATPNGPQDVWRDGIIARALQEPGIILFDEVDRGAADIHYAIHSVYTGEGLTLLDDGGRIQPMHPMNRVFTTSNTKGRGSMDGLYQASEEMTEATRRRLTQWVEMDYQSKEEDEAVLEENFDGIDEFAVDSITHIAATIREEYKGAKMSQSCSITDQIETARRYVFVTRNIKDETMKRLVLADCVRMIISNRANEADKMLIESTAATKIGVDIVNHGTPFLEPTAATALAA
jgi:MoxR-like ATPase